MVNFITTLTFMLIMTTSFNTNGNSFDPLQSPRLIAFKNKIAFDSAMLKENKNEHIDMDWAKLPTPPGLDAWKLQFERNTGTDNSLNINLDYTNNEEQINITIKVFNPKENKVSDYFLIKADSVSTMNITDLRGPPDLGTISLVSANTPSTLVYWIYRNVFAEVSTYKTNVSALNIANWLQQQIKNHTQ